MLKHLLHRAAPHRVSVLACSRLQCQARTFSLPAHEVIGMPALSPTMEVGTIVSWLKAEGELVSAGETIAEIETDKATISFDAVDDSFLAKILVDSGTEVAVGQPIMVTVEEESDVAAFSSFSVAAASTPSVPTPEPVPAVSVPTPPTPPSPPPTPVKQVAPPSPAPPAAPPTPTPVPVSHTPTTTELQWGSLVKSRSPLAAKIAKDQQAYVEKYGNSSHVPLDC